ncbi:MAG: M48 family metalloprotease [Bacteroidales bacterium]|nr:M48 family metalloprotease [Bacteroidales bacterium]
MKFLSFCISVVFFLSLFFSGCEKDNAGLISGEQETELGRKIDSIITGNGSEYTILDTAVFRYAYAFLDTLSDEILKSGYISRKGSFIYQIRIIENDRLHTFAAPGGYLYFFTGLLKYIENGAQFAGLLAHMIAHTDRRHITLNVEHRFGIDPLLEIIWHDNQSLLSEVAGYITTTESYGKYSAAQESEADEYAVKYTSGTDYDPRGIADFYARLAQLTGEGIDYKNIHPDYDNRTEKIYSVWESLESPEGSLFEREYNVFRLSLPGN